MKYTKFTGVEADEIKGDVKGNVSGNVSGDVTGALKGGKSLSKSADYSLSASEKAAPYVGVTLSAASKTVTLGLANGQVMIVANEGGTNAFTLKNVSGDSGTSLAAGKVAIVVGSTTANGSKVYVLN